MAFAYVASAYGRLAARPAKIRSLAEDYWRPEAEALLRKHGVEYWWQDMAGCRLVAGVSHRLRAYSCSHITSFWFRNSAFLTRKTKTWIKTTCKNKEKETRKKTFNHVLNDLACPDQNPKFGIPLDNHTHAQQYNTICTCWIFKIRHSQRCTASSGVDGRVMCPEACLTLALQRHLSFSNSRFQWN